jgi:hypothetical protein
MARQASASASFASAGLHFGGVALVLLAALAAAPAQGEAPLLEPMVGASEVPPAPWHVVGLPQQTKPFTRFSVVDLDGRRAVRIEAELSYGNLVHTLKPIPASLHLSWQWRVERPLENTDLHEKSGDDTEVKVCVFYDEPMESLTFPERQILRMARSRSADPVPTATVCYVWDSHLPADTAIDNAFTRRQRYIVVESGTTRLNRWVAEKRDLGADFTRLFGAECPVVPPIIGIAIGADSDNTKGHSIAYVGELKLEP